MRRAILLNPMVILNGPKETCRMSMGVRGVMHGKVVSSTILPSVINTNTHHFFASYQPQKKGRNVLLHAANHTHTHPSTFRASAYAPSPTSISAASFHPTSGVGVFKSFLDDMSSSSTDTR